MSIEIKNIKKAAERIKKAIDPPAGGKRERIILYGDADLDGVSSVIILKEAIQNLGGEISAIYFPDREKEGYGINKKALDHLKNYVPVYPPKSRGARRRRALLIAMDCGIGNFEEVKLAEKLGFEVIIIDHHEVLKKLPSASIIVDPKQKGDKYPFKEFAAVGLVYKFSQVLLGKKMTDALRKNFLELTALATIADMMSQTEDNKILIDEGLRALRNTFRPGLRIFQGIFRGESSFPQMVQKIISVLNIGENQDHLTQSYLLLTATDEKTAREIAMELLEKSEQRRQRIREITEEVGVRISDNPESLIVFEGDGSWPLISLGPVASRICNRYQKPVFLFRRGEKESPGAVRTPPGIDGVKAMMSCSKFLETYGGHPQAAGFRVKNENQEKFKKCLIQYFN